MNAFKTLASLALLISTRLALVQAAIYVTDPVASTVCHGGQSCNVAWVDDGQSPLLSSIGECTVGLYNGEMVLVQSLTSVDVSSTTSLSFTPNPSAGANGAYYLVFTSNGINYQGWSATFTLDSMTGSAGGSSSGISTSAGISTTTTSTLPGSSLGPSSVSTPTSTTPSSTSSSTFSSGTTVSATTLSAPTSTLTTSVTSSGLSTITTPSSSATSSSTHTSSASTTSATQSGAAIRAGASTSLAGGLFLALAGALAF